MTRYSPFSRLIPLTTLLLPNVSTAQAPILATEAFTAPRLAWDLARDRLIAALPNRGIWEWDGVDWSRALAATPPLTGMVYDPIRARAVFVAGDRVREYDGFSVTDIGPSFTPAPIRLAIDPANGRLTGVSLTTTQPNWINLVEYDPVTGWQARTQLPGQRVSLGMAFDPIRGVAVIDVLSLSPTAFETWEWNGTALNGPIPHPSGFYGPMFWDPASQRLLAAGAGGTRAWDGVSWSLLPTTRNPGNVVSLATDPVRGLTFACPDGTPAVLVWDGSDWSEGPDVPQPLVSSAQATYDSARDRVVLLGEPNGGRPGHVEWDGRRWLTPTAGGGSMMFRNHGQAFDATRGETIAFGGRDATFQLLGDTWAYDGTSWRLAATTGPSPRAGAALAFDSTRGVVALVGGEIAGGGIGDHWQWNGVNWNLVAATTPIGPDAGVMGYDPLRDRLVYVPMLPGPNLGTTWEYDGSSWTQQATSTPRGSGYPLVFDPVRQKLQGVLRVSGSFAARYEWDGATWQPLNGEVGALAIDTQDNNTVVYSTTGTFVESTTSATANAYGSPCGGSVTATSLSPFGRPLLGGNHFHLDVRADATLRPVILGLGIAAASIPLGNGCTLLHDSVLGTRVWFTDANGFLHQPLPIPAVAALRGVIFRAQAGVLDPSSPGGLALTQGLWIAIGD
ncbi:MAG: hypothetical protein KDE27_08820 [Planctomycetes bacterium]|nr:hypothetical protein [Planctomycetota bacterium]